LRWFRIFRLCWDKRWTTLCVTLQFCAMPYLYKLFIIIKFYTTVFSIGILMA
jgi:hypothetical protein